MWLESIFFFRFGEYNTIVLGMEQFITTRIYILFYSGSF